MSITGNRISCFNFSKEVISEKINNVNYFLWIAYRTTGCSLIISTENVELSIKEIEQFYSKDISTYTSIYFNNYLYFLICMDNKILLSKIDLTLFKIINTIELINNVNYVYLFKDSTYFYIIFGDNNNKLKYISTSDFITFSNSMNVLLLNLSNIIHVHKNYTLQDFIDINKHNLFTNLPPVYENIF